MYDGFKSLYGTSFRINISQSIKEEDLFIVNINIIIYYK